MPRTNVIKITFRKFANLFTKGIVNRSFDVFDNCAFVVLYNDMGEIIAI